MDAPPSNAASTSSFAEFGLNVGLCATAGAIYGVTGAVWLERPQFPMMVKGAMRFGGLGLVYFGTREAFVRLAPQETISEQQYYFSMGAGVITGWLATGFQTTDMRKIIRGSAVFGAGALGLHFAKDALNNWRINRIVHTQYPQAPLPEKPHAASAKQPVASDESSTPTKSKTWTEWFVEGLPIQKVEDVDYQRLLDAKIKVAEYEVRQQERRNARLQQQIQMEQQKVQPQAQAPSPPSNNV